jgi:Domain of unknown function (DUF4331)
MSDHLDSPGPVVVTDPKDPTEVLAHVGPPMGDAATDITDVFAFQKPSDPGKTILVVAVNPLAPALAKAFEHDARYEINVDTDGDALADRRFVVQFSQVDEGVQHASVRLEVLEGREEADDDDAKEIIEDAPVSFGATALITTNGRYKFFAGLRSDPFFFDLLGFLDEFDFSFGDFFAKANVFGIVLEVPNRALGRNPKTAIWARTKIRRNGHLINDDRVGRAGINTVFNHGQDKNIFNDTEPSQDRTAVTSDGTTTFLKSFTDTLVALSNLGGHAGYSASQAAGIAAVLLPDMLTYDYSQPANYAMLNGRRLQDDVIDISLNLVTKGLLTSDNVGPHTDYLSTFPFLGTPH